MSVDKLVDSSQLDTDLTSVANAIRTKGGTSAQLAFPAGFVSAVQAIPTGVTPTGTKQISIAANGTTTEDVAAYANAEITVNVQGGGGDYVAVDWIDLSKPTGEIVSNVKFVDSNSGGFVLYGRTGITKYTDLLSTGFPQQFFNGCTALKYLVIPKAVLARSTIVGYCTSLLGVDFAGRIGSSYIFTGCTKLNTLVLRSTTQQSLSNVNSFSSTPFASGKAGGTLYVPNDLIASYQAATNWSTILGYANNQIKSIESTHTDPNAPIDLTLYYIDGTPIPTT